jgi:hypothetical protein
MNKSNGSVRSRWDGGRRETREEVGSGVNVEIARGSGSAAGGGEKRRKSR